MGQKINPIGLRLELIEAGTQLGLLKRKILQILN